jgi:hypothetical protein
MLQADDEMAGRKMRCSRCKGVVRAPGGHDAPPEEPARPQEPTPSEPPREPAPRRGPDSARQTGRSLGFVLAAIFGLLLLGSIACCGGGYLLLPGENWRRHQSGEGGFAVDLPAPVKKDMPIPGVKPEPGQKVEGTVLWKRGEVYAVVYIDISPAGQRAVDDEAALDAAVKEMRADPEARVVREDRVKVSGFPGREVESLYSDGGTYVTRFVVADRRFYVLITGGRFVRPGNANVRRFLDSFEVTDPPANGAGRGNFE